MTNIVDMNALQPEYKRKLEYYDGDNADIMRVLERNFIAARNAVAKNGWYKQFEGRNLDETCRNVWEFIKTNIPYQEDGIQEQKIVMPPRAIANAKEGIGTDCKSMALMACAIISHYSPVGFRYTSYRKNPTPTHVYCIVDGGRYIVDAVWNKYNSEKPYKFKYDKLMKISTLSGIDNTPKLKIDADVYKKIVAYDTIRKQFTPGSERRKLFDLLWSAELKTAIDEAKNDGMNGIDELSAEVDKIFNANQSIGAISKPDWATNEDRNRHLLNVALAPMVAARVAFHALANFNAFGIIDRLFEEEKKKPKSISRWWYRAGGNPDELWKFLTKYKGRKPFFGVQEKIQKLIDTIKKKAGIGGIYDESINEFGIGVAGVDDVAVAGGGVAATIATITSAIPVLVPLIQTIGNIFNKNIPIPDNLNQPPVIKDEPTTGGINKNLLIYGAIGVGAVIIIPKLLKTNK